MTIKKHMDSPPKKFVFCMILIIIFLIGVSFSLFKMLPSIESTMQEKKNAKVYKEAVAASEKLEFYKSYQLFSTINEYTDAKERKKACIQPTPATSLLFRDAKNYSYVSPVTFYPFENKTSAIVKIYRKAPKDNELAAVLFLDGTNPLTVTLSRGYYTVHIGFGESWFGSKDYFGGEGNYLSLNLNDKDYIQFSDSYKYSISLDGLVKGKLPSFPINYSDF